MLRVWMKFLVSIGHAGELFIGLHYSMVCCRSMLTRFREERERERGREGVLEVFDLVWCVLFVAKKKPSSDGFNCEESEIPRS